MSKLLQGKTAIVLGVWNKWSIAYAIAHAFAREGAKLLLTYQNERARPAVEELGRELGVAGFFPCEVQEQSDIDRMAVSLEAAGHRLDIVVHSSTHPEPFGCVIAEAMACARPVVVSAAGGAAEIVRAGEDALTFEPGDADALAACIRRLAEDAPLRSRLGHAGRAAAVDRFDRVRMAREMISAYEELESAAG